MRPSCRDLCSDLGEPLAGSAGKAAAIAAISWPKPRWHPDRAALSAGLPARLGELELAQLDAGKQLAIRVFQRTATPRTDRVELLVMQRSGHGLRTEDVPIAELPALLEAQLSGDHSGYASTSLGAELLVCTDGKHDPCCALHGRSLYESLRGEIARRGSAVRVAEASHLGGHRFAANCLELPAGRLYGRVTPGDAADLIQHVESGRPFARRYRGRHGASELAQIAEAYLLERLPALESCTPGDPKTRGDGAIVPAEIQLAPGARRVSIRCVRRAYPGPASCAAEPGESDERLRWVAVGLEEG